MYVSLILRNEVIVFHFRGQSFKGNSSNRLFTNKDDGVQDETQGEITESIGGLYEIPELKQAEGLTKRKVILPLFT